MLMKWSKSEFYGPLCYMYKATLFRSQVAQVYISVYNSKTISLYVHQCFVHYLSRCYTAVAWNILISHFVEFVNTRQECTFSKLKHCPFEFNSRRIPQHSTNWVEWNKFDEVWNSMNYANSPLSDVFAAVPVVHLFISKLPYIILSVKTQHFWPPCYDRVNGTFPYF